MSSDEKPTRSEATNPFALPLEDLEATVRVPLEDQVTEEDTAVPMHPSDAEQRRAEVMRVIAHGS